MKIVAFLCNGSVNGSGMAGSSVGMWKQREDRRVVQELTKTEKCDGNKSVSREWRGGEKTGE